MIHRWWAKGTEFDHGLFLGIIPMLVVIITLILLPPPTCPT